MQDEIRTTLRESAALKQRVAEQMTDLIARMAQVIIDALRAGHKVAFAGNGGSAADAQHLSGELIGRFRLDRPAYAGLALTTDTSILTAIGNDYGFEEVFARQVEGLLTAGDVLVVLSTSGNAANCIQAIHSARRKGVITIGMTGETGGRMASLCDLCLCVPHTSTARIQEVHITVGHIICGMVEQALAGPEPAR